MTGHPTEQLEGLSNWRGTEQHDLWSPLGANTSM